MSLDMAIEDEEKWESSLCKRGYHKECRHVYHRDDGTTDWCLCWCHNPENDPWSRSN